MKKRFLIVLTVVGLVMPALAQNNKKVEERIQLAREKYATGLENIAINKQYEEDETPAVGYTTVVRKQNWAAIGQKTDKMEFYYNEIEDEMDPYPVGYALCMVRRTYNIAPRQHLEEYLFDDNGKPLFYFSRFDEVVDVPEGCSPEFEVRLYFDENGKVIRSIYKMMDENNKMKEITEKSHPEVVKELDENVSPEFNYVKGIFDAIY